ncbi:MAG: flagellar hook-length control protein FliK, partial [Alphaproteobacteria bacterium]|nr:flagellar hook-length control protein FliK [Alphaproteobacteria bacterium]
EIAKEIEKFSLDKQSILTETLNLNQKAFNDILKSIENGTIVTQEINAETESNTDFPDILNSIFIDGEPIEDKDHGQHKLQIILDKIEKLIGQNKPIPLFIATNLTPENITNLKYQAELLLKNQENLENTAIENISEEAITGVLIGLIKIVPVQTHKNNLISNKPVNILPTGEKTSGEKISGEKINNLKPNHNLLTRLNTLVNNNTGELQPSFGEKPMVDALHNNEDKGEFNKLLKQFTGKESAKIATSNDNLKATQQAHVKPDLSALTSTSFTLTGSLSILGELAEDFGLTGYTSNITSTGNLTQLITQAQHASHPHPATQIVATTIQKSLNGSSKTIALQLDPPELGKVEISMQFSKNKTVKISIISEKPETFMMLQRDAHALERILENAGLDVEGSMNFELADDNHNFNHNGKHDGSRNQTAQNDENNIDDIEILNTSMTWHVDPKTGHMRYNLIA